MTQSTSRDILYQLCTDMGVGTTRQRQGTSLTDLLDRLRDAEGHSIAIVDEVSFLADPSILATLYKVPDLTVVAITINENGWFASVDQRVESRFRSATKVHLEPYGPDELRAIIDERIRLGLEPGVIDDGAVDAIVGRADGDARFAITLLRRGAREIMNGGADEITADVVETIEPDARETILDRYRRQLDTHQRLLYELIEEAGDIRAEVLHQQFCEHFEDDSAPSKRTRNRYLTSLRQYGLIELEGRGRAAHYSLVK
jgi:Cdc6-like AAA superfamily ATPase